MHYLLLVQIILGAISSYRLAMGQLYHQSSAKVGVDFQNLLPHQSGNAMANSESNGNRTTRNRYMYALCPPGFQRVGTECYSLLAKSSSWLEAHFYCKDKNAKLAEPRKFSDRKLREFLHKQDAITGATDAIWIGASYDWLNRVWQWSHTGHNLTYDAFNYMDQKNGVNMENQCAVFDPTLNYRWSSRLCVDKQRFLCQHKMPKVSEKNRYKVYNRWNVTYPNQFANEVLLHVIDRRTQVGSRINRRVKAEDSSEEMLVPIRRPGHSRRRPSVAVHPNSATGYIRGNHPNRIPNKVSGDTTTATYRTTDQANDIEIPGRVTPVPEHIENERRRERQQLLLDRKLKRQREKEIRRMRRKKERQENMLRERQQRLKDHRRTTADEQKRRTKSDRQRQRKHREGKLDELHQREHQRYQQQLHEKYLREQQLFYNKETAPSTTSVPVTTTTTATTAVPRTTTPLMTTEGPQITQTEDQDWHYQNYLQKRKQQEEQERLEREAMKRKEYELQLAEQHRREEERKLLKERQRKEYEEQLQQKANEKARLLLEEQERIRLQDEANRKRLEFEEQRRQEELKQQLAEEEERLRLEQAENERRIEEEELARVREENKRRMQLQRKREEEIARLEKEKQRLAEEEERFAREQELAEQQRKIDQQREIELQRAEEEARIREEHNKRIEEQEYLKRLERIEKAKQLENERQHEFEKQKPKNYSERIAKLSKEDREKFLEMRKLRRTLKEQLRRNQAKEAATKFTNNIDDNNNNNNNSESFIPTVENN